MKQKIPLYLIESFLAAAEDASFQVAAERLQITQSTLSKQMIQLEEMLPHPAFSFDGRKKVLTAFGVSLYQSLKPKLSDTQEIINQVALLHAKPEKAHVRICGRGELLDLLAVQLKTEMKISLVPMDNESALASVLARESELAIVHSGVDSNEIVLRPFLANQFQIAVSKKLLKAKPKDEVQAQSQLRQLPCLYYKPNDPVMLSLARAWRVAIEELNCLRTYPNYATLARMVHEGLGWTVLPSHIEINESQNHLIPMAVSSELNRKFYLCYRKDNSSAGWLKHLVSEIKAVRT